MVEEKDEGGQNRLKKKVGGLRKMRCKSIEGEIQR